MGFMGLNGFRALKWTWKLTWKQGHIGAYESTRVNVRIFKLWGPFHLRSPDSDDESALGLQGGPETQDPGSE